jgi:hypothetical protein
VDAFNGRTGAVTLLDADMPARLSETSLNATYAPASGSANYASPAAVTTAIDKKLRPSLFDITSAKPNGTPTAFTSGQPTTLFGSAPLAISGGAYVHTPFAGANSAGYIQADMLALAPDADGVYHIGTDVAWEAGATPGALALVLTDTAWVGGGSPVFSVAKVHMTMYGNGIHDCAVFNNPGIDKYMDTEAASTSSIKVPRFADVRDGIYRPVDIQFNPNTGTITIVRPDGSAVMKTASQLVGFHPSHAIFELYESDGTTATPAKFKNPRATTGPDVAAKAAPTINDVAHVVSRAPVPSQLLKTTTQYRPATTETILVPTGTAAEILGTGAVQISRVSGVVPVSGKVVIRIKAYMVTADARSVFWNLVDTDTGTTITSRRIVDGAEAAGAKWIDEEFYLTGGLAGATRNYSIHQLAGGTGTPATGITAGQNPSRPVTVEFIPVN